MAWWHKDWALETHLLCRELESQPWRVLSQQFAFVSIIRSRRKRGTKQLHFAPVSLVV